MGFLQGLAHQTFITIPPFVSHGILPMGKHAVATLYIADITAKVKVVQITTSP